VKKKEINAAHQPSTLPPAPQIVRDSNRAKSLYHDLILLKTDFLFEEKRDTLVERKQLSKNNCKHTRCCAIIRDALTDLGGIAATLF
jgi:hypothetical protein